MTTPTNNNSAPAAATAKALTPAKYVASKNTNREEGSSMPKSTPTPPAPSLSRTTVLVFPEIDGIFEEHLEVEVAADTDDEVGLVGVKAGGIRLRDFPCTPERLRAIAAEFVSAAEWIEANRGANR